MTNAVWNSSRTMRRIRELCLLVVCILVTAFATHFTRNRPVNIFSHGGATRKYAFVRPSFAAFFNPLPSCFSLSSFSSIIVSTSPPLCALNAGWTGSWMVDLDRDHGELCLDDEEDEYRFFFERERERSDAGLG